MRFLSFFVLAGTLASAAPALQYSTYLRDNFSPKAIAVDPAGNIYLTGSATIGSQSTILVAKLNPQATQYLYLRYLGGSGIDAPNAIAVDPSGNAVVVGFTASTDFPVTANGRLASPPTANARRSFAVKLDPSGNTIFSDILGGTAASEAQAVAINSTGQILITGLSTTEGFPSTPGAYKVPNTPNRPYILALDPTGTTATFSATGIGGRAIALDPAGNIYLAGQTTLLDYPTTPGTYQPELPASAICYNAPCSRPSQAQNQYVTKLDPSGSTLLYSTGVTGKGNTINTGLAVDATGNVYITGFAGNTYPYTVPVPSLPVTLLGIPGLPFLTKLDALGQKVVFSVPVGGNGVQVDAQDSVYVGGSTGLTTGFAIQSTIPVLANIPARCLPNGVTNSISSYTARVSASTGDVTGSQFIGGSTLSFTGTALSGSALWLVGTTSLPDFPFTENTLTPTSFPPGPTSGAYLGATVFNLPDLPRIAPQIACVLDAADLSPAGPVVRNGLVTVFGTNLGLPLGVSGTNESPTNLGGTAVTVAGRPAPLLYASPTQVNFAVPEVSLSQPTAPLRLTLAGSEGTKLSLPLAFSNPKLFLDLTQTPQPFAAFTQIAVALNADGSLNSPTNPATLGSTVSVFANGLQQGPQVSRPFVFADSGWLVTNLTAASPYVTRIDLRSPTPLLNNFSCPPNNVCSVSLGLYNLITLLSNYGAQRFSGTVYVQR
ncbi:MAG: SBBP repeat-containing protein [Bryobacteraceae bacterium]